MDCISNENSIFFCFKPPHYREHLTRVGYGPKETINQILKPANHGGFFYGYPSSRQMTNTRKKAHERSSHYLRHHPT